MFRIGSLLSRVLVLFIVVNLKVNASEWDSGSSEKSIDLPTIAQQASREKLPIMLMFVAEDCEYCERLENDIIKPMLLSGDFNNRAIVHKIYIDKVDSLTNFAGQLTDSSHFAGSRGIQVTPTLQFVDATGQELMPQVIGYQGPDFFGAYLDNAIGGSLEKMRHP